MSVRVGEQEAPRVSLFRAQLRSVLETLLNDAVAEITRVYHVSTSASVSTVEADREEPPQDPSPLPPCKTDNLAVLDPEVPASPPSAVSFKKEDCEPFEHPMIVHVTSLARKDVYSQTDGSCFHPRPCISTATALRPPTSTAPLKKEVLGVCMPIDQDQAQLPESASMEAREQGSDHTWSKRRRGEVDNVKDDEHPGPSSPSEGNTDTDQNRVVSSGDSQERGATQQETFEPLVLRARAVPRRRSVAKLKAASGPSVAKPEAGCKNLLVNGGKITPDQMSQSQTSCLLSTSLTPMSECHKSSSMSADVLAIEDEPDEGQPDNMEDEHPPGSSALERSADTGQEAKCLKSCMVQLVKVHPFLCHLCSKVFNSQRSLIRHLRFHAGGKPYMCKRCSKSFKQKGNLKKHYKIVHSLALKSHSCNKCGRSFALQGNLMKHDEIVHGGRSPSFHCKYCMSQYSSESKLAVHVRVHTGEKPHRCIFCKKKHYRLKKNLIKHMLKHLGYGPGCGKSEDKSTTEYPRGKIIASVASIIGSDNASQVGTGQ